MLNHLFFRITFLLGFAGGLLACSTEAVNRDRMINLDNVALKSEIRLSDLDSALEQDRGNAVLLAKRALLYFERGQLDNALADISRALELNEDKGEYYFRKALILREAGQIKEAQQAALEAENRGFKETDLYVLQAELLIRLKNYPAALEKVNFALEEAPDHDYALFYRGVVRAASNDTASALINFRRAIRRSPSFVAPYLHLSGIYNARKDYVTSGQYLAIAGRLEPENPFLWLQKGIRYNGLWQLDSAVYSLKKAVAKRPDLSQAHYHLGMIAYKQQDFNAVVHHLEKARAQTGERLANLQEYLAEGYEKTGQYRAALREYQQLLARNPEDVRAGWGVRRSNWALYKIQRDSLKVQRQKGPALTTELDSIR